MTVQLTDDGFKKITVGLNVLSYLLGEIDMHGIPEGWTDLDAAPLSQMDIERWEVICMEAQVAISTATDTPTLKVPTQEG